MTDNKSFEIDRTQRRLGPIWLMPDVIPSHVATLFYSGMITIVFITASAFLLPYLLHEHLHMPTEVQGDFTGNLTVIIELFAVAIAIPVGVASDRWGRRPLYAAGFLVTFLGFMLLPLARDPATLVFFRLMSGMGTAIGTTMLATAIADYPQNASRGKLISINGIVTNIGVILLSALLFARLPSFFIAEGADEYSAGTYTFWTMAALSLVTAGITFAGLKGGRAVAHMTRDWRELFRTGTKEVRKSQRLVLACGAYFVSRGDLTIFTAFFSLWLVNVGTDAGMAAADATSDARPFFAVAQFAMLAFTPVMGILCDRFDRVTAVGIGMATAFVGYLALGIVSDPFHTPWMWVASILAGAGEAAVVVSCPALVGQEAPAKVRGAIIGVVSLFGALGVVVHSKISGMLFDSWMYQAPFIYMAGMNALIFLWAILLRVWEVKTGAVVHPTAASALKANTAALKARNEASASLSDIAPTRTTPPPSA